MIFAEYKHGISSHHSKCAVLNLSVATSYEIELCSLPEYDEQYISWCSILGHEKNMTAWTFTKVRGKCAELL